MGKLNCGKQIVLTANHKVRCVPVFKDDPEANKEFSIEYDYLIIAVGAQVNTFGTPGVLENCHFLKEVEDAQRIRRGVIDCCSFDERIISFAKEKFLRDGIDVQMGMRVMSVSDKEISVKIKSSGQVVSIPHGLVLWSTGIGTRPVISDLMEQVGQGGRQALATNEWLQVKGCENVYAVGDCASIAQRKIMVCKTHH